MAFAGFPESGLSFFRGLVENNDRDWFEAHRKTWDEEIVPSMLEWCGALAERLRDVMPRLVFVPRIGGSLYRLNRDIRFSRDKSPYKTHVAALLWDGAEKHDSPVVYLHVSPEEVIFGGGIYLFEEARLDRFRKVLRDDGAAERLDSALAVAKKGGLKPEIADKLQRPARGFDPEGPRAEQSKWKGLTVVKHSKPAGWLHSAEALDRSEAAARAYAPLHEWMCEELY
ncbi:MAG TPA: DUF2461 domain-containing protein [Myxococcales bacterium]|jgi:uncharacterized protein (TIGR02453 family)|nr:DUF2461 domain-containing protein [Myxococcales bacterium]